MFQNMGNDIRIVQNLLVFLRSASYFVSILGLSHLSVFHSEHEHGKKKKNSGSLKNFAWFGLCEHL